MGRYGCYSEKTYRHHFNMETSFFEFNYQLVKQECTGDKIIAVDCSYLAKSGKQTPNKLAANSATFCRLVPILFAPT